MTKSGRLLSLVCLVVFGFVVIGFGFTPGCAPREVEDDTSDFIDDHGGGSCGLTYLLPVEQSLYKPGSYQNRSFLSPGDHLGVDIALRQGTAIRAIGPGRIVWYEPVLNGYGELAVAIEHRLDSPYRFKNGAGTYTTTDVFFSIYGHLRPMKTRGETPLNWKVGDIVSAGDTIGFVNDDLHNGDGGEHLHFGIRLMSAEEAKRIDPGKWFRGYDVNGRYRGQFASPNQVIAELQTQTRSCDPLPPQNPNPQPPNPIPAANGNHIRCSLTSGALEITAQGNISRDLVGDMLNGIGFISLGSNETGWNVQTTPPRFFTIYNGDQFPHAMNVPKTVRRFNLWVGGPSGSRWFDLTKWNVGGETCAIVPDGSGGLVIVRH